MAHKKSFLQWLGLGLIVLALCFIPLIPVVAVMPLSVKMKAALTTFFIVGGQILTWVGAALLGKELLSHYKGYRKYLNPRNWFRKGTEHEEKDTDSHGKP